MKNGTYRYGFDYRVEDFVIVKFLFLRFFISYEASFVADWIVICIKFVFI